MDAMKKAIMARRMKLADLGEGEDEMKAEGLLDDKKIQEKDVDGLAPDIMGDSGDVEFEIEAEKKDVPMTDVMEEEMPEGMDKNRAAEIEMMMSKDDLGKPGMKGKVAAKMMEALKKLKI